MPAARVGQTPCEGVRHDPGHRFHFPCALDLPKPPQVSAGAATLITRPRNQSTLAGAAQRTTPLVLGRVLTRTPPGGLAKLTDLASSAADFAGERRYCPSIDAEPDAHLGALEDIKVRFVAACHCGLVKESRLLADATQEQPSR